MIIEGSLSAEERQERPSWTLREENRVGIEDAAKRLGVHPMTICRDLKALERSGHARPVRGCR